MVIDFGTQKGHERREKGELALHWGAVVSDAKGSYGGLKMYVKAILIIAGAWLAVACSNSPRAVVERHVTDRGGFTA